MDGTEDRAAPAAPLAPRRAPRLVPVALLIALGHGAFLIWRGVQLSPDSGSYAAWAERLVQSGFDYQLLLGQARTEFPAALYGLFVTLLAVLKLLFGEHWPLALVALNFAVHVALGVLVVRLALRTTASAMAGWAALILYLGCFDLLNWTPFVLSDTIFVWLAFAIFSFASARILRDAQGWWRVALPAAAGCFFRPTGFVLLPDLALAAYLSSKKGGRIPPAATFAAGALTVVAGTFLFAWLMEDPARWPFDTLSMAFETVSKGYSAGEVVSARLETYHLVPDSLFDRVLISVDRFVHFFAVGAAGYSAAHWLVSLIFFLPCYALAGWLAVAIWRGDHAFGLLERRVFLAATGAILAYALFHALVQVDYDWRYRLPVIPHLILLASAGAADLSRRWPRLMAPASTGRRQRR